MSTAEASTFAELVGGRDWRADAQGTLSFSTLAALRKGRGRTQVEIAEALATTQSAVSRMERQNDILVSTLAAYVDATGGGLRLVATYPGGREVDIVLVDQGGQP